MRQSSLAKIGDIDAVSISIDREIASRYDDVKIVADNIDDVVAVASVAATAATVAASIGAVTAVASNIDAVVDVHNNTANIATIVDNFANMNTVASNIADVSDVASGMADILTASSSIADIIVAADNIARINQVAADTAQINEIVATVVPNMAEILLADDRAATATSMAVTATTQAGLANTARVAAEVAQGIAETKATEAGLSAAAADVSADLAAASEAVATTKANAASASADAAHVSELAAAAILDTFDDIYLGSFVVDPVTDNDGQPLLDGTLYFNTSANVLKVYNVGTTTWYTIPQTLLSSLLDVQLTSTTVGDMLSWNGTKWVNTSSVQEHITDMNNPHSVTKAQVGLSNVDNTSDVTKNVLSATKLTTPRAIALTGDVTGTADFDGSAGVSITTTVADDSHLHAFTNLTSKPTTLSGYGITDAINASQKGVANGVATLDASGLVPVGQLPSYVDDVLEYTNLGAFPAVGEPGKIYVALDTNKTYRWSGTVYIYITSGAVDSVAGKTGIVSLVKDDVGLSNVDNTSDLLKPISTATAAAFELKAPLASPALTGTPTAPTAAVGTNTTQLATTAFVKAEIANDTYSKADVDANVVHKTGDETIAGVKTFSSSPIVPTPTIATQAASKGYVDSAISKSLTTSYSGAYGLDWDSSLDMYYRTGAAGYASIQSLMRRCVLNANGTVNYYLHPNNSNYKADGVTPSVLTGADGNVMVEIPKFYYKYAYVGTNHTYSISLTADAGYVVHPAYVKEGVEVAHRYYRAYTGYADANKIVSISGVTPTRSLSRTTFRTYAKANGTGWGLTDWNLLYAVQMLLLIEIGTFDSQKILGTGNYTGNNYGITTGGTNLLGNNSSTYTIDGYMSYRGIENFYADCWEWVDGININNYVVYINNKASTFADDVYTEDYASTDVTLPAATGAYISNFANSDKGFLPSAAAGSSTTYITDGFWSATGSRAMIFGGGASKGALAGAFCLAASSAASVVDVSIGGGVCY